MYLNKTIFIIILISNLKYTLKKFNFDIFKNRNFIFLSFIKCAEKNPNKSPFYLFIDLFNAVHMAGYFLRDLKD